MSRTNIFDEKQPNEYVATSEQFPAHGFWSRSNNLGNAIDSETFEVGPPPAFAQSLNPVAPNTILLQTNERWFPHEWTLSLWAEPRGAPPDNQVIPVTTASIEFGIGGSMQRVEVDFVRGTKLTLTTNSIIVKLLQVSPFSRIYAQAALGTRGPCGCPQRQVFSDLLVLAGANSAGFLLPSFIDKLEILRGSAGNIVDPLVFVEVSRQVAFNAASIVQSVPLSVLTANYGGAMSLNSEGVSFRISNTSGADIRLTALARLGL